MSIPTKLVSLELLKIQKTLFALALVAVLAPIARANDALNFTKNYFVTGDYAVAGVGLRGTGASGLATGTITLSGIPAGADIVAAFLYWQTVETTAAPSSINGFFDGKAIVGAVRGNPQTAACTNSGAPAPSGTWSRVYRADVLRYLPVDSAKNVRVVNGPHTVKLPDSGGGSNGAAPYTNGASLVVVYRMLTAGTALRSVVIYDGAYTLSKNSPGLLQLVGGFYEASFNPQAKITHIVGNGQAGLPELLTANLWPLSTTPFKGAQGARWDNPTFNFPLLPEQGNFLATASALSSQVCLTWSAMVVSANVRDSDGDGLLDVWEVRGLHLNPGDATHPATFGTCDDDERNYPCVNLPAMGANPFRKDIFVEIDWMHGTSPGALPNTKDHLHIPKLDALNAIGATFLTHGIQLHFDVGNNYQTAKSPYVVPAKYTRGGEVIEESSLLCPNAKTTHCDYTEAYTVLGWKIGYSAVKNGFPALNLPAHFDHNRKDVFHYVLFAHALSGPFDANGKPLTKDPASVSGVADRPGGDLMITLGLWSSDTPGDDQTGSTLVQAGTLMHELGHNLGLSHAGLYRTPNCEPNYPSVMNYLYQTRGLTDAAGGSHIDFSYGLLPKLNENSLSETVFSSKLTYRVRFYGPVQNGVGAAKAHCDGTPTGGAQAARLEAPIGSYVDWNNNGILDKNGDGTPRLLSADVDFNGSIGDGVAGTPYLVDSNDWGNLNLQQIGARLNVAGLSADVGQTDLGQTDLGQTDLGQTDLGQTDLGQTDLGQTDLGQTDLGQTDLGDVDYQTAVSSLDATSPSQPLTATSSLTGITLNWGAPTLGLIRNYLIYRSDPAHPTPSLLATLSGTPPVTTYTDAVNSTTTLYNTNYTYFIASEDNNSTISSPSNNASGIVKHLFIAANNKARYYGDANPAFDFTTTGQDPGLTGTTTCRAAATVTAASNVVVGGYPITCSGQSPAAGITYTAGTLTVNPAPLTINAVTYSKPYDGTTAAAATPTYSGLKVAGQTVTGLSEVFDSPNAGNRTLSVSTYTINDGNGGANYAVSKNSANGSITQAVQTIGFAALPNLSLGAADFTLTATATSGLPVTYEASGNCTVTGTPVTAVHLTGTGSCTITAHQTGNGNYFAAANVAQTFTIGNVDFTLLAKNGNGVPLATTTQITMTTATGQASSAWLPAKVGVGNGFTTQFTFQITQGSVASGSFPADGLAFVIQNGGVTALGGGGGSIGYEGIASSLAVEFDTYKNDPYDPNANHAAIQTNGTAANSANHLTVIPLAMNASLASTLASGTHTVKITYDGTTLLVFLDTTQILSATVNLNTKLSLDGAAFVGFTSATGAAGEQLVISNWSFTAN